MMVSPLGSTMSSTMSVYKARSRPLAAAKSCAALVGCAALLLDHKACACRCACCLGRRPGNKNKRVCLHSSAEQAALSMLSVASALHCPGCQRLAILHIQEQAQDTALLTWHTSC